MGAVAPVGFTLERGAGGGILGRKQQAGEGGRETRLRGGGEGKGTIHLSPVFRSFPDIYGVFCKRFPVPPTINQLQSIFRSFPVVWSGKRL